MALGRPKPARIVGRYQLVAELATSYLGPLWAVRTEGTDNSAPLCALRLVSLARLDADTRVRLLEAAWQAMEVRDARVRSVTDVVASDGELGVISEYEEGVPLRALQGLASVRRKPLPVPVALRIVMDVTDAAVALARATTELGEEAVPLYGGLSPDSIVVGTNGGTSVLDVAVASVASSVESLGGNPERVAYSAPEQIGAEPVIDGRSDVFTIGIVAWELLSGRRLFVGSDKVVGQKVLAARIPRMDEWKRKGDPEIPAALLTLVSRALARDPAARPQSAEELARLLSECGVSPATEVDVKAYVEAVADGALSRTRDALREPTKSARPEAGAWGKLKSPESIRSIPTLSVAGNEKRSLKPAPVAVSGPKPLTVALGGPRPRQPTMIGIPPPARPESSLPPAAPARAEATAKEPVVAAVVRSPLVAISPSPALVAPAKASTPIAPVVAPEPPAPVDLESPELDGDEPTTQYNARDLLKQVEEMSRRSDPAKRLPSEFPEPTTSPAALDLNVVPLPPLVPAEAASPLTFPLDGGWLDDPLVPESVEAASVREEEDVRAPVAPAPNPVRATPDPATALAEAIAAGAPRAPRSIAPAGPSTGHSLRAPERSPFSLPPKAPAPFIPSQIPPPLIHDPRATRKQAVTPPSGPQFTRGVVIGVVVSLGLVIVSAAIAVVALRGRKADDVTLDRAPTATRADALPLSPAQPSSGAVDPVAPAPETSAPPPPEAAPEPATAATASPPVTASVATPPSLPQPAARPRAGKSSRASAKKQRSRFVPDDI